MKKTVFQILHSKYPPKEYAVLSEVSDAAGFSRSRSADYIVMSLWPSRGLSLSGIELKSHRSDWLSERKKPEKAENIFQYCDYFWLLTDGENVAKLEEIPLTWGWMHIKGGKIFILKEAPHLTANPISKNFLAALLKRAADKSTYVHVDEIEVRIREANESGKAHSKTTLANAEKELRELNATVREFETATGINLARYHRWATSPKKIGEAVRFIQDGGVRSIEKEMVTLEKTAKDLHDKISRTIESLKSIDQFVEQNKIPSE